MNSARQAIPVLDALRSRNQLVTSKADDIIFGLVMPVGEQGQCMPRVAAIAAGYSE